MNRFEKNGMLIFFMAFLLSACAALGPLYVDAPSPKGSDALVHIYRPSNTIWIARDAYFYINDVNIVDLSTNGYTWFHIPAGEYILKQKWPPDLTYGKHVLRLPVKLSAQQKVYYRLDSYMDNYGIVMKSHWRVIEVSEAQAKEEMKNCKFQSPSGLRKLIELINQKTFSGSSQTI